MMMQRKLFDIENISGGKLNPNVRCDDCANTGLVMIDGELDGVYEPGAAPCPMCYLGGRRNSTSTKMDGSKVVTSDIPHGEQYWSRVNLKAASWNGGVTIFHRKCWTCGAWHTDSFQNHVHAKPLNKRDITALFNGLSHTVRRKVS